MGESLVFHLEAISMNEENKCSCKHIKGIVCNVKNCVYHHEQNACTASEIAVGPTSASTSAETLCVTFRPKTEG